MTDITLDLAADILAAARSVTVPLTELARRLGTLDADGLAARLDADPRFLVIEPAGFLHLAGLPDDRRAAYDRALRAAGVLGDRRVAWVPSAAPAADADAVTLLVHITARLLSPRPGPAKDADPGAAAVAIAAADRAGRVLAATLAADA
jgi:hypothetical protein